MTLTIGCHSVDRPPSCCSGDCHWFLSCFLTFRLFHHVGYHRLKFANFQAYRLLHFCPFCLRLQTLQLRNIKPQLEKRKSCCVNSLAPGWCGCNYKFSNSYRVDSRFVPSQWETSLQSNGVSHWLVANLESALLISRIGECYMTLLMISQHWLVQGSLRWWLNWSLHASSHYLSQCWVLWYHMIWHPGVYTKFSGRLSEEPFPWLIQKFPCILIFKTGQPGCQFNLSEGQIRLDLTSGRPLV